MKALFVCDDKEEWALLNNLFKAHFAKVELVCALKAETAFEYLSYEGPFGLILIDAGTKSIEPSELARQALELVGDRPLIFLGDKVMIRDRVDEELIQNHDCNDVIYRPYDLESFKEIIQTGLDWAKEEEFEQSVQEFERTELIPMKLRSFYLFDQLDYDVYVELTQTKFARVLSAGKPYTQSMIHAYAKKNVKFLYLKKNEYLRFLDDSINSLTQSLTINQNSVKKTLAIQIKSVVIIHQYINAVGVTDNLIELVQLLIQKTAEVSKASNGLKDVLSRFPRVGLDIAEHSILTMYVCESLCAFMGWSSEMTRAKLGLSSILQDCALSNENLLKINRLDDPYLDMFTEQERKEFEEHPHKAAEYANYFTGIPESDYLLRQHHELPNGEGFPGKMNANKLTLLSCTFILASHYCARLVSSKAKTNNLLQEVYLNFKLQYNTGNFKDPLMALEKSVKNNGFGY